MKVRVITGLVLATLFGAQTMAADVKPDAKTAAKAEVKAETSPAVPEFFARIGDETVPIEEYAAMLQAGMKNRFYHGTPPEVEVQKFKKEVADELVMRTLMLQEAKRRGVKPDSKAVDAELAKIEQKYKDNKHWQENKQRLMEGMRKRLSDEDVLKRLQQDVKRIANPSVSEVKGYYEKHKELFTTPEKEHVKMILIKVPPSAKGDDWRAAEKKGAEIVAKLKAGGDFAKLARIHSGDPSASNGGDLGYMHKGMLGAVAQQVLDTMKEGELSAPVSLLEGVGIFRLVDREKPRLNEFSDVEKRARELYVRERSEQAWKELGESLKKKTKIVMNEKL